MAEIPDAPEQHPNLVRRLSDAVRGLHHPSRSEAHAAPVGTHTATEPIAMPAHKVASPPQKPIQFSPPHEDPVNPFNAFHLDDPDYHDLSRRSTRLPSVGEETEAANQGPSGARSAATTGAGSPPTSPRIHPGLTHIFDTGDFIQDHVLRGASGLARHRPSLSKSKSPPPRASTVAEGPRSPGAEPRPPWAASPDQIRQWREEDKKEIRGEQEEYAAQRNKEQRHELERAQTRLERQQTKLEHERQARESGGDNLSRVHTLNIGALARRFSLSHKGEQTPATDHGADPAARAATEAAAAHAATSAPRQEE